MRGRLPEPFLWHPPCPAGILRFDDAECAALTLTFVLGAGIISVHIYLKKERKKKSLNLQVVSKMLPNPCCTFDRNLSVEIQMFFSDKENVHLSAKRMATWASDRGVAMARGRFCSERC